MPYREAELTPPKRRTVSEWYLDLPGWLRILAVGLGAPLVGVAICVGFIPALLWFWLEEKSEKFERSGVEKTEPGITFFSKRWFKIPINDKCSSCFTTTVG